MRKKMKILVDDGHGKENIYKASPDGKYKEWAWTCEMADLIVRELKRLGYDASLLTPELEDIPLNDRVRRANRVCADYGKENVIVLSVHSNANSCDGKWHDGEWSGFTAVVAPNASENSKLLADFIWARAIDAGLKGNRAVIEKPGKRYVVKSLAMCRDTHCPAVLTESAFHDTHDGVKTLTEKKQTIMLVHVNGIIDYINYTNSLKR